MRMPAIAWIICAVCASMLFAGQATSRPENTTLAGFAEIDITPPVGIDLGGRGCFGEVSRELLDPLSAQASVLRDSHGQRLVIVSMDLIGLDRSYGQRLREDIASRLQVPSEYVLLNCSHTHSGPMMSREALAVCGERTPMERQYLAELANKLIEICVAADRKAEPVRVAVHEGPCDVGINRRGRNAEGIIAMLPNLAGPHGRNVWVLSCTRMDGTPVAVLFSHPCHPVIVYGYARRGISADFPSAARREIRAVLGRNVHAQFLQGLAGNLRPRVLADLDAGKFRPSTPEDPQRAGHDLAASVLTSLKRPGRELSLDIAARSARIELPLGTLPQRSLFENAAKAETYGGQVARHWLDQYDRGGPTARTASCALGVVRLSSEQWICWISGEPVIEWALLVSKWFAGRPVVPLGYTQEVCGYLPVDALLKEGGYEVDSSNHYRAASPAQFAPGLDECVRKSLTAQLAEIERTTTQP